MHHPRFHRGFTPEAIANIRHRYLETDESQTTIAADFGIHRNTLVRLAKTQGWTLRRDRAPRDLPADLRMVVTATQAVRATAEAELADRGIAGGGGATRAAKKASGGASIVERLERAVEKELRAVELLRATIGAQPQSRADAERTARTLERLTDTLFKVRRLRQPENGEAGAKAACQAGSHDDIDLPRDIDEFRRALAQRIELFVRARADAGVARTGEPGGGAAAQ